MGLKKKSAYMLTEKEIRYAIANSTSIQSAARFLNVTSGTFKKYAQMYFDAETGKSLHQLAENMKGKRTVKTRWRKWLISAADVIEGKHPTMPQHIAKEKFINDGIFPDECGRCGYCKQRETDYKTPTIFVHKNGIKSDFRLENVEILCWNCYFLYYGDVRAHQGVNQTARKHANALDEIPLQDIKELKSFVEEGLYRTSKKEHTTANSANLRSEFDEYMENLSDEEYEKLFGHERPT
jgi:5-methylcytosine-specific restriction endonuclease McrA